MHRFKDNRFGHAPAFGASVVNQRPAPEVHNQQLSIKDEDKARLLNDELELYMEKLDSEPAISENEFHKIFPKYLPGQFSRLNESPYPKLRRRNSDGFISLGESELQPYSPIREKVQPLAIKNKRDSDHDGSLGEAFRSEICDSGLNLNSELDNIHREEEEESPAKDSDDSFIEAWRMDK